MPVPVLSSLKKLIFTKEGQIFPLFIFFFPLWIRILKIFESGTGSPTLAQTMINHIYTTPSITLKKLFYFPLALMLFHKHTDFSDTPVSFRTVEVNS
jgi:hypothetical protein